MIVLDTHALVWWVSDPGRLPTPAAAAITESLEGGVPIHLSSISAWEVALLVERGRIQLRMDVADWLARVEAAPEARFIPVDNRIAIRSVQLPGFEHRDPADRIIAATAIELGATLVTADQRLKQYPPLVTLWD